MFTEEQGTAPPFSQLGPAPSAVERPAEEAVNVVVPALSVAETVSAPADASQAAEEPSQKSRSACIESARLAASWATRARILEVLVLESMRASSFAMPNMPTQMTTSAT